MKKSMKKLLALLLACLMLSSLGTFMASAAGETDATAWLTKEIKTAEGTAIPAGVATFTFTSYSVDGSTTEVAPAIPNATITFTEGDSPRKAVQLLGTAIEWPHAGEYAYDVAEQASGFTLGDKESMTYSTASYRFTVIVANKEDGGLYIKDIVVQPIKPGGEGEEPTLEEKVNTDEPTPYDPEDPTSGINGFLFTNEYTKKIGSDPTPNPDDPTHPTVDPTTFTSGLEVKKTVAGDIGDRTAEFPFKLTLTKPTGDAYSDTVVHAFIAEDGKHKEDVTLNYGENSFKLKHNQSLVLIDVYAGTTWTAEETDALGHNPVTTNASGAGAGSNILSDLGSNYTYVTNTKNSTTPAGLLIDSLPFIALAIFAAAGLVLVLMMRRRREVEEN